MGLSGAVGKPHGTGGGYPTEIIITTQLSIEESIIAGKINKQKILDTRKQYKRTHKYGRIFY